MPLRSRILSTLAALGLALGAAGAARAQSSGVIENTARMTFQVAGVPGAVDSNTVSLPIEALAPRRINIMRLAGRAKAAATLDAAGTLCRTAAGAQQPTVPEGEAFDPDEAVLTPTSTVHVGEPVFVDVVAPDADLDPTVRDRLEVVVTTDGGDREVLSIMETGPSTGRFVGYIDTDLSATPTPGDCVLSDERGRKLTADVVDPLHPGDQLEAQAVVDPYGYVFRSGDGTPVDGARVTLIDEATGGPAAVVGDDGVSTYPSTVTSGQDVTDASGLRYSYASGQYRFPRVAAGRYHLQIDAPQGLSAPSTATPAQLATLVSPTGAAFEIVPASFGRPFDLAAGADLNADLPVDGQASALSLDKTASATDASAGDFVQYRLTFRNRDPAAGAEGVRLVDVAPRGFHYVRGSARLNGSPIPDPAATPDGRSFTYPVGTVAAGSSGVVSYVLTLGSDARPGDAVNRAQALGNGALASNVAQATVHVRSALYTDRITIVGRVTEGDCDAPEAARKGVGGVRLLMQDGTFTVTDADGLYHFEGVRPGLQVVQIDPDSPPRGLAPKSCGQSTRRAGSDISQFVETQGGTLARADFQLRRMQAAAAPAAAAASEVAADERAAGEGIDWFAGPAPLDASGAAWLFPGAGHNPRAPALRIAVAHRPGQHVELTINGAPVDAYNREGDETSADGGRAVTLWRGVALKEGDNLLTARVTDAKGAVVAELARKVHYANRPARAAVVAERSLLAADGMSRPVIAVRFSDASGAPVRAGVMGAFRAASPYAPAVDVADRQERTLDGQAALVTTWRVVGDDGVALIALSPTTRAGEAVLDLPLPGDAPGHPTQVRTWLKADRKSWVVVGFAAGTLGFDTLSRHADPLTRTGGKPDLVDGQLAFYAKGRVKGSWLLTLAYDNKKTADRDRGLAGGIDPDRDYTIYGDASVQGDDAQSRRRLYVRLERRAFYALFGDFQTGFDATELGRYDRTFNGLKFERQGRALSFAGFVADSAQTHVRDEIQGSGIAGPYQLSRHDIVVGSEQIVVETRDRTRSERVLATRALTLHVDYDIDDQTGMLSFAAPVLSRDELGDPNIIVAQYEVEEGGAKTVQAGARATARAADGRIAAGVTYLHDGQALHDAATDLLAADLKLRPRADTEIRLEAAVSDRDAAGASRSQTAYVAEIEHRSQGAEVLAYYRRQDLGYGVGQQALSEAGAEKTGVDGKLRLTPSLTLSGSGWTERYMANGATRDAVDARLDWLHGDLGLTLGLKVVRDDTATAGQADSTLLTLGASRYLLGHRLQLTGSTDISLDGPAASLDFPVRHRIGAAYSVNDGLRLNVSHEIDDGAKVHAETTTAGVDFAPWKGAKMTTALGEQGLAEPGIDATGPRTFGQVGLTQALVATKRWAVDASVDTSTTLSGHLPAGALLNSGFPTTAGGATYSSGLAQAGVSSGAASGSGSGIVVEDFRAVSLGGAYHATLWSWTGRAEARFGDTADTWSLSSAYLRQLRAGVTAVAGLRASDTRTTDGARTASASLQGSLAWRPLDSRWSVLDRLELRNDTAANTAQAQALAGFGALATADGNSGRIVNNFVVNYDSDTSHGAGGVQTSLYYGAKYVSGRFGDDLYTGFVDAAALQLRYNLTSRIDVGISGGVEHAWASHTLNFAAGPSVGVSPAANTWISLGWNVVGFRDRDFEASAYTHQGPYIAARLKFDQASLGSFAHLLRGGG